MTVLELAQAILAPNADLDKLQAENASFWAAALRFNKRLENANRELTESEKAPTKTDSLFGEPCRVRLFEGTLSVVWRKDGENRTLVLTGKQVPLALANQKIADGLYKAEATVDVYWQKAGELTPDGSKTTVDRWAVKNGCIPQIDIPKEEA